KIVVLAELKARVGKLLGNRSQSRQQGLAARNHEAGMAAQHLRVSCRQMELAATDIDPHIVVGRHQIGIAREPEPGHVEQRCEMLVRYGDVDVLEMNGIAEILGGAIECLGHGITSGCRYGPSDYSWFAGQEGH